MTKAGKRVGRSFYVQVSAIENGRSSITLQEANRYWKAKKHLPPIMQEWNLMVCIDREKIRFLKMCYTAPHPHVEESVVVYNNGKTRKGKLNRQIYHRMNVMIDPEHPSYGFHYRLTDFEESIGALGPFRIGGKYPSGHLSVWKKQLKSKCISYDYLMEKIMGFYDRGGLR